MEFKDIRLNTFLKYDSYDEIVYTLVVFLTEKLVVVRILQIKKSIVNYDNEDDYICSLSYDDTRLMFLEEIEYNKMIAELI